MKIKQQNCKVTVALDSFERMAQLPSVDKFLCILQECRKNRDLAYARRLHAYMCESGLESHKLLGNYLVSILLECGSICNGQQVFTRLKERNVYSWTSFIVSYMECGESQHLFGLYQKMQEDFVHPSNYTFVVLLKACTRLEDVKRGQEMHTEVARKQMERDPFVGNTLVDMYAKCGSLVKAREVFDKLSVRDVVSWNILISRYAERGLGEEALKCFEQMQMEGLFPNAVTFLCSLKACRSIGALVKGQDMHAEIARKQLERHPLIGNTLIDMYAKCGCLSKAHEVFDKLPVGDAVSWNILIAGYAEHGLCDKALDCFHQMQLEGVSPDAVTLCCSLKACGSTGAIKKGQAIHAEIAKRGLEKVPFVGNALVDMYAKCGLLAKAQEVFDKLPVQDVVSWNILVSGYAEHGLGKEAVNCLKQMQVEGLFPNDVTFICSLKACASIEAIDKGQEIHAEIARKELESNLSVGNTLVDMYAKCGSLAKAQEVFDRLPVRDVASWSILIAGYAEHGLGKEAMNRIKQMQVEGICQNAITLVCSLKAFGSIGAIVDGRKTHAEIARKKLEKDPCIGSTLVDMYAKCGLLANAREVFDKLPVRDVVLWTALVAGYANHGLAEEALDCFRLMQLEGVIPNIVTFVCSLRACASMGAIDKGLEIHAEIAKQELERDPRIGTALLDMYGKCGLLTKARQVFDKLPVRNAISWTALVTGYGEYGLGEEALKFFEEMEQEGVSPDAATFVSSLKVCGSIGAIDNGREIHSKIARNCLERDLVVGSAVVDMYSKCGSLEKAWEVFDKLPVRDVVSWTALIAGYAQLGESECVFHMVERMRGEGISPNRVTFLSIFAVCCHAGLVDAGQKYFEAMNKYYGLTPTIEHHTYMVDLLGRAGQLQEAVTMVEKMPFQPNLAVWHTLLGACQKWGNVELGRWAFEYAVRLDRRDAAAYVLMSNVYADAHMQEDRKTAEEMRVTEQAWISWNDVGRLVHTFIVAG